MSLWVPLDSANAGDLDPFGELPQLQHKSLVLFLVMQCGAMGPLGFTVQIQGCTGPQAQSRLWGAFGLGMHLLGAHIWDPQMGCKGIEGSSKNV